MSQFYNQVEDVKKILRDLKYSLRKCEDEDKLYREYCEGVLEAAIAVLGVIRP